MPTATRKPAAKKTATRKPANGAAKPAAKRTPAKKAATPSAATKTRKTAASTEAPATASKRGPRVFDKGPHGFVKGTDQAIIADLLIKGGEGRGDITEKAKEAISTTNRNGNPKPVGTMVANVIRKLEANGYVRKESIKLVKPKA